MADKIVDGGDPCRSGGIGWWHDEPDPRRHPDDDGVLIGVAARLEKLPEGDEAVMLLCPNSDRTCPPAPSTWRSGLVTVPGTRWG